jgi:hypothetical protein
MKKYICFSFILGLFSFLFFGAIAEAATYYISPTGSDSSGSGSSGSPWKTLNYALSKVNGGDRILLKDGLYEGRAYTNKAFSDWVTIKAENPYRAKLSNIKGVYAADVGSTVYGNVIKIETLGSAKIIIQDLVISSSIAGKTCSDRDSVEDCLVFFSDAQDVTLKNNIIFGNEAGCKELIKISSFHGYPYCPKNVSVEGNVIYDHVGVSGADMIDSLRNCDLDIHDNLLFARETSGAAQSFITLKAEAVPQYIPYAMRSPRVKIYRNVLLNYYGKNDQAFIQLGEDGLPQYEVSDALIENNLLIGNSSWTMAAPFQFKGVRDITVRANTIVGNYANVAAYGFRIGTEGDNLQAMNYYAYNNIWSDPTGTMSNLFTIYGDVAVSTIKLKRNLFWNNGNSLPSGTPGPSFDANKIIGNPQIRSDQSIIVLPIWDESQHKFLSGNTTIKQEFERLVNAYGALGAGSAAIKAADPANMPKDDILGKTRGSQPDIGAFEYRGSSSCTCSFWTCGSCGAGGCAGNQRQQTRTCTPSTCDVTTQCVADSSCGGPTPDPSPAPTPTPTPTPTPIPGGRRDDLNFDG